MAKPITHYLVLAMVDRKVPPEIIRALFHDAKLQQLRDNAKEYGQDALKAARAGMHDAHVDFMNEWNASEDAKNVVPTGENNLIVLPAVGFRRALP